MVAAAIDARLVRRNDRCRIAAGWSMQFARRPHSTRRKSISRKEARIQPNGPLYQPAEIAATRRGHFGQTRLRIGRNVKLSVKRGALRQNPDRVVEVMCGTSPT